VTFRIGSYTGGRVPGATILGPCFSGTNATVPVAESGLAATCANAGAALRANKTPKIPLNFDSIGVSVSNLWTLFVRGRNILCRICAAIKP